MLQQNDQIDSPIIGFCLNLECPEENSDFGEEYLTDPQNHNKHKNDCESADELEIFLEYLIYELEQKISQGDQKFIQTYSLEMQSYQKIIQSLNQGQYKEICEDINILKIKYSNFTKYNNQNKIIEFWLSQGIKLNCSFHKILIINQQNWDKALQYFEKILKQQLKNPFVFFYLSIKLIKMSIVKILELNQCYRSQKMFDKLKKEYPKFYEDSIERSTEALKLNENDLSELLLLGHSLNTFYIRILIFENKSYVEAIKISDRILQIDNNNMNALMGKIASLLILFEPFYSNNPFKFKLNVQRKTLKQVFQPVFKGYFQNKIIIQIELVEQHQFYEAMVCYDNAIQLDPNYVDAYYNKGNLLFQLLQFEDAIIMFDKVIQFDPYNPDAYNNKGVTLQKLNKHEEALICFDKAIKYDPNFELAHKNKGTSLNQKMKYCLIFKLENYMNAIISYDKAIYLDSTYTQPYKGKGESLYIIILFVQIEALNQIKCAIKNFRMAMSQHLPQEITQKLKELKNLC